MSGPDYAKSSLPKAGRQKDWRERLDWILLFNGVVWRYSGGYAAKIEISEAGDGLTPERPEGIEYCFTFHEPGAAGRFGKRIYGIDNAHSPDGKLPWDHEHVTKWPSSPPNARPKSDRSRRFSEPSVGRAFEVFATEVEKILERLLLPTIVISQTQASIASQGPSAKGRSKPKEPRRKT